MAILSNFRRPDGFALALTRIRLNGGKNVGGHRALKSIRGMDENRPKSGIFCPKTLRVLPKTHGVLKITP